MALARAALMLVIAGCGSSAPVEPNDVDVAAMRTAFRCSANPQGSAADACRVIDEFAAAGPVRSWPTGTEEQVWLGVDHCVQPTASPEYATYQLVYLKAGTGSPPASSIAGERHLAYAAVFGSHQVNRAGMPSLAAALESVATGSVPEPAALAELWRNTPRNPTGAYHTLARTKSGTSVGDGPADSGSWFVRSDGTHLLLVGPRMQGGCASRLFRVPS